MDPEIDCEHVQTAHELHVCFCGGDGFFIALERSSDVPLIERVFQTLVLEI